MRAILMLPLPWLLLLNAVAAEPPMKGLPIIEIENVPTKPTVFQDATRKKPLIFRKAEEAAKYFEEKPFAALKKKADFDSHMVLVFAWHGSGQDKITYRIAESYPEQITFEYQPGRTRDYRPHVRIYALRKNVQWTVN